jgi:hypothetical protein
MVGLILYFQVEGRNGTANDVANSVMQRFWDSALALEPPDEEFDSQRSVNGSFVDFVFLSLFIHI